MLRFLLGGIFLLLSCAAQSAGLELTDVRRLSANASAEYIEDPQGRLTVDNVRQPATQWQPNGDSAFNQGYSMSVWWLHLQVRNATDLPAERYLELSYAVLDYVDVYVYAGAEQVKSFQLGDLYPYDERPVDNRFFVVPLQWQPGQTLDIYYRIKTSSAVQAPLTLWERDAFVSFENNSNIAQGLYYGAMAVIAVYNLLIFLVLLERAYLFYVGFVVSLPMFMAAISGQGFRYLWPDSVAWNDHSIPLFLASAFMFSALFARRFLQVGKWSGWADKVLLTVIIAAATCAGLSFVAPYYISIHLLVPLGLFACIFDMVVGTMAWRQKVASARYYLIAWGMFLAGGVLFALNKLGVLPANFLTEYSMQIGSLLEAVLLSFAMAERINVERKLRFEAQDAALQVTRRLNEELEQRVQERTHELEKLNHRLEELSNTDQLTGLKNRRYLETALAEEWERGRRYQRPLSVLMLDVDFFKRVNDQYGHPAGDACLKQVAQRIKNCVRWPSDQVSRYGGEEFCMLLPETDSESAMVVAERVRAGVEAMLIVAGEKLTFNVTVSVGLYSEVPTEQGSVEQMLKRADLALYQSKEAGRNRITRYGDGPLRNVEPLLPAGKRNPDSAR